MIVSSQKDRLLRLIEKSQILLESRSRTPFFSDAHREQLLAALIELKKGIAIEDEQLTSLLQYIDVWNRIRVRIVIRQKDLLSIWKIATLNAQIYRAIAESGHVKTVSSTLTGGKCKKLLLSEPDTAYLVGFATKSATETHVEYSGFGKTAKNNDSIRLAIDKTVVFEGSKHSSFFSFSEFFAGGYHFFWHVHPVIRPFSNEDRQFHEATGIPNLLATSDGQITFLLSDDEITVYKI